VAPWFLPHSLRRSPCRWVWPGPSLTRWPPGGCGHHHHHHACVHGASSTQVPRRRLRVAARWRPRSAQTSQRHRLSWRRVTHPGRHLDGDGKTCLVAICQDGPTGCFHRGCHRGCLKPGHSCLFSARCRSAHAQHLPHDTFWSSPRHELPTHQTVSHQHTLVQLRTSNDRGIVTSSAERVDQDLKSATHWGWDPR